MTERQSSERAQQVLSADRLVSGRYLVLLTDAYGGRGGIAKFNREVLAAMCALSVPNEPATLVVLPRVVEDQLEPMPRCVDYRLAAAHGKPAYAAALLRTLVEVGDVEAVLCGHINLLPLAALAATWKRTKVILVIHGVEAWTSRSPFATNLFLKRVNAIASVSEFTKNMFLRWASVPPQRIHIVPNSIDLDAFVPGEKPQYLLARYGLSGRRIILTLSRLETRERYKGHDEIIDALPEILASCPDCCYVIAGDGSDRERLEMKVRSMNLGSHVEFVGRISEAEKADHYRMADAFAMPGRGEGFGIVYLEAMACGIPVIASSLDASQEAVRGGQLGAVVDPQDRHALVAAVVHALRDTPKGRPEGLAYFSVDSFRQRWERLLSQVVDAGQHQR